MNGKSWLEKSSFVSIGSVRFSPNRMLPICKLQTKQKNTIQTVVLKVVAEGAVLDVHCSSWVWNGGGAAARVDVMIGDQRGQYLVFTNSAPCGEVAFAERLKRDLHKLPGSPQVEWVCPLSRRLQRLFGWGDVARACEEDCGERALMPLAHDPFAPTYAWKQHPTRPLPFFVIDHDKLADEEKVTWLRQELGSEATLPEFSAKFLELFGNKLRGIVPQKAACLKLFAMYRPGSPEASWKKEAMLPPRDLVEFQRVWDPEAPSRCLECNKPLKGTPSIRDLYCDDKCRMAGFIVQCKRCTPDQKCSFCRLKPAPKGERTLDQMISENMRGLKRWREVTQQTTSRADPDHEPEWRKRRRS